MDNLDTGAGSKEAFIFGGQPADEAGNGPHVAGDGSFLEGCMTKCYPSSALDHAVHANIAAARYGK